MSIYTITGCKCTQGFTLIQLAVILVVMSVMVSMFVPSLYAGNRQAREQVTILRMQAIERALNGYSAATRSYPCPADATLATNNANFGVAMTSGSTACSGGNFGASNSVVAGMVPIKELGLSPEYALDGFNRRITYMVDQRTTNLVDAVQSNTKLSISCSAGSRDVRIITPYPNRMRVGDNLNVAGWPLLAVLTCPSLGVLGNRVVTQVSSSTQFTFQQDSPAIIGLSVSINGASINRTTGQDCSDVSSNLAIQVKQQDGSFKKAAVALISHGANGHGAFPVNGSSVNNRINSGSTNTNENDNASVNSSFQTSFDNVIVADASQVNFDDITHFKISCVP